MTKAQLLKKLLIKPKKLTLKEGEYAKSGNQKVLTNITSDISYLLSLCGCENATAYDFDTDNFRILIGTESFDKAIEYTNDEEYYIEVSENSVCIESKSEGGALLGLKALIRMTDELGTLPCMEITDYPDIEMRAVHMCVFKPNDGTDKERTEPQDIKNMIKTAALCGYNYVFIEMWGMFPYSVSWAHWPNAYTMEQVNDIISFAIDKMHITPCPTQNLTSHAGWSRLVSRQHVALDQNPKEAAELYIQGGWCFTTENPKTKEFLKLVMDELISAFRNPPYFHASCDKTFGFGSSEEDRVVSADVLFVKHLSFLNDYLRNKNTKMVMWGDMLYSSMDAFYWKCSEHTSDYLPKNIIINIWTHNDPGTKWQDAAFFENKGFRTLYSPFMNYESIASMISLCHARKSYGMVQTTWHRPQSAVPYVIFSGALQFCGKKPESEQIEAFANRYYKGEN